MTTPAANKTNSPPPPPAILSETPVIPLILIGIGGYLLWFGVKYWRGAGAATWPSYPIKSVLQGKGIPPNTPAPSAESELASYESAAGSSSGSGGGSGSIAGYVNPFSKATITPSRVDQGVDFGGSGPVTAIGPAVVTFAGSGADTGWGPPNGPSPGGFIRYKLTGGPATGKEVYVAEGVQPSVTVGQKLTAGQVIGTMVGSSIETGWASGVGTQPLSQTPGAGGIGGAGPFPTKVGVNFDRLLIALGVPAAPNLAQPASGDLPPGYPDTWTSGDAGGGRPQNTARMLLSSFGWGGDQMPPLTALWTRESGWRPTARNPQSGALGIAQALGHGTSDTSGTLGNEYGPLSQGGMDDWMGMTPQQMQAANSGSVLQQIRWGLGYIQRVYGSPGAAERHEQTAGWY